MPDIGSLFFRRRRTGRPLSVALHTLMPGRTEGLWQLRSVRRVRHHHSEPTSYHRLHAPLRLHHWGERLGELNIYNHRARWVSYVFGIACSKPNSSTLPPRNQVSDVEVMVASLAFVRRAEGSNRRRLRLHSSVTTGSDWLEMPPHRSRQFFLPSIDQTS